MNTRRITVVAVLAALGAIYFTGWWPQSRRRASAERDAASARAELTRAEARVGMGRLLIALLGVNDAVTDRNYGQAQDRASAFFEAVRAEAGRTPVPPFRVVLELVLQSRDAVTAGLARTDPGVIETLRHLQAQMRDAMSADDPLVRQSPG